MYSPIQCPTSKPIINENQTMIILILTLSIVSYTKVSYTRSDRESSDTRYDEAALPTAYVTTIRITAIEIQIKTAEFINLKNANTARAITPTIFEISFTSILRPITLNKPIIKTNKTTKILSLIIGKECKWVAFSIVLV